MSEYPDPVLEGLKAPVGSAMVAIYETQLNWRPDNAYRLEQRRGEPPVGLGAQHEERAAVGGCDADRTGARSASRVLIAHGLFDLVTPYFGTQLLLDQMPEADIAERIQLSVHPGGHMFYTDDISRAALRDEAGTLFGRR